MLPTTVCRVCLGVGGPSGAGGVKMRSIDDQLEIYEKLTNTKLKAGKGISNTLCYICYSQLQKFHRFTEMALKAEKYLIILQNNTKISEETRNNFLKLAKIPTLSVTKLKPTSIIMNGNRKTKSTKKNLAKESMTQIGGFVEKVTKNHIKIELDSENEMSSQTGLINATRKELTEFLNKNEDTQDESIKESNTKEQVKRENSLVEVELNDCQTSNTNGTVHDTTNLKEHEFISDKELTKCHMRCKTFTTVNNLITHQISHTTMTKPKLTAEEILNRLPKRKKTACPICNKYISTHLVEHLRIHTGERPYICDLCGKTSQTKYHLKYHMVTHTGEKVYNCKVCNKSYSQSGSLGRHMITHSGEKPYSCHICGKSYTQKAPMRAHIRCYHEGVKAHSCDVCRKKFCTKVKLSQHMNSHTGKKLSCDNCNVHCSTTNTLRRHIKHYCKEKKYNKDLTLLK